MALLIFQIVFKVVLISVILLVMVGFIAQENGTPLTWSSFKRWVMRKPKED